MGVGALPRKMVSKSGRDSSLRIASRRNVLPASVPRASTRRLTDEMRCSGGSGVTSCATTLSPGLFGFQNNSEKFRADHRLGSKNAPAMNCAEEHTAPVRRRYPRYEIDTELHVTTPDESAAMRGRSLNISGGGTAGVFATEWKVGAFGPARILRASHQSADQGWRNPAQPFRLSLRI